MAKTKVKTNATDAIAKKQFAKAIAREILRYCKGNKRKAGKMVKRIVKAIDDWKRP